MILTIFASLCLINSVFMSSIQLYVDGGELGHKYKIVENYYFNDFIVEHIFDNYSIFKKWYLLNSDYPKVKKTVFSQDDAHKIAEKVLLYHAGFSILRQRDYFSSALDKNNNWRVFVGFASTLTIQYRNNKETFIGVGEPYFVSIRKRDGKILKKRVAYGNDDLRLLQ